MRSVDAALQELPLLNVPASFVERYRRPSSDSEFAILLNTVVLGQQAMARPLDSRAARCSMVGQASRWSLFRR